jgi:hypothetical protein
VSLFSPARWWVDRFQFGLRAEMPPGLREDRDVRAKSVLGRSYAPAAKSSPGCRLIQTALALYLIPAFLIVLVAGIVGILVVGMIRFFTHLPSTIVGYRKAHLGRLARPCARADVGVLNLPTHIGDGSPPCPTPIPLRCWGRGCQACDPSRPNRNATERMYDRGLQLQGAMQAPEECRPWVR